MPIQLRLLELMKDNGYTPAGGKPSASKLAAALAKDSRIGQASVYRLVRAKGKVDAINAAHLEALADLFGCEVGDLFKRKGR